MSHVLSRWNGEFTKAYLDDIIVYSMSWEQHLEHLGKVLEQLELHGLTCSISLSAILERGSSTYDT